MKPVVAIVGRPNVGKSTLFNRIIGSRTAIVEDQPGITRDRLYRDANWLNYDFTVIDTGGIDFTEKNEYIASRVRRQAEIAIDEADVILFVTDGQSGVTQEDEEVAHLLRRSRKPVVLAVNKIDNFDKADVVYEFYNLGLGDPIPISSVHAMNVGDLLDAVCAHFPPDAGDDRDPDTIAIAVIGRPNVGKSSLCNRILGEERSIVSDLAGTTRDAIDTIFQQGDKTYIIIDTAGMRRRGKIAETTERYSVSRALRAVDRCDVALMVLDATAGVTEQDKKIAGYAHEAGKGILLVINKWDALAKDDHTMHTFEKELEQELAFMPYALSIFVSAASGQRVDKILPLVDFIAEQASRRLPSSRLNEVIEEALLLNPPPTDKGRKMRLYYTTQVGIQPPKFIFFVNDPELMHFSYLRYLENKIREAFGFAGTPIWLKVRGKKEKDV